MGIYKKENRWYIDYYLPNGKRKREAVTIKGMDPSKITREDAKKALSIRKAEIAQGKFDIVQTIKPVLFEKLVNAFIRDYSKVNKKSWSRDVTSSRALLSFFGGKRLSQITKWQAEKYKSKRLNDISRLGRTVSQATVNRELACLKTMFNFAVGEGWLSSNPLSGFKLFKERPNKVRVVTAEEFQKVYDSASEFIRPILVMAINTGMRRSEILNLKWESVNLKEGHIRVEESKNGESRYIPLSKQLNEALKSVKYKTSGEFVFNREGERIRAFKTAFTAAVRRSGIERFTFHDLRHTFASVLVMNGVDLATVQELLGHKSINMTKRYSHPTPEHKRRAIEKLKMDIVDTYLDTKPEILRVKLT
ncbi:MAG: tyrosine-type recombinase/integrase [Thermodesulfobacteriota bacterium]